MTPQAWASEVCHGPPHMHAWKRSESQKQEVNIPCENTDTGTAGDRLCLPERLIVCALDTLHALTL